MISFARSLLLMLVCTMLASAASILPPRDAAHRTITSGSLVVDSNGTQISFTDSGAPSKAGYITIFAVNGLGFNANIFQQIQPLAVAAGFRFVAVNRRGYGTSTPFTSTELNSIVNGTDAVRTATWQNVGVQLLSFIDNFAQQNNLQPVSSDRKTGGVALVSWSFGCTVALQALAAINTVPTDMQGRLAGLFRTFILQEPPSNGLGLALPPQTWLPQIDPLFPANIQVPTFAQWITSYFDHGDLSTRDPNQLQFILASFLTTPSAWNNPTLFDSALSSETEPAAVTDTITVFALQPQLSAAYTNAIFGQAVRSALPNMKTWYFIGTRTAAFLIDTLWFVQNNATTLGEQFINFKVNNGTNHFVFWDFPQQTVSIYQQLTA